MVLKKMMRDYTKDDIRTILRKGFSGLNQSERQAFVEGFTGRCPEFERSEDELISVCVDYAMNNFSDEPERRFNNYSSFIEYVNKKYASDPSLHDRSIMEYIDEMLRKCDIEDMTLVRILE